jgi:Flp pilus assembly pilin Flp
VGSSASRGKNQLVSKSLLVERKLEGTKGGDRMISSLWMRLLSAEEEGQTLIEYALIVSLISVVAIGALKVTGTNISDIFTGISNAV